MTNNQVFVYGEIAIDNIINVPHEVDREIDTFVIEDHYMIGGLASNVAVLLSLRQTPVDLSGYALGDDHYSRLGALVPGHLADLIVLNMAGLHAAPNYSVIDNIIYTCTGRDVEMVIVNGQVVVQDGKLCTANEEELVEMAEIRGRALIRRAVDNDPELSWLWK